MENTGAKSFLFTRFTRFFFPPMRKITLYIDEMLKSEVSPFLRYLPRL